jgi:hypothetical protein
VGGSGDSEVVQRERLMLDMRDVNALGVTVSLAGDGSTPVGIWENIDFTSGKTMSCFLCFSRMSRFLHLVSTFMNSC